MLMIKRPADHDKVNPQKATTAHMWTTTLLQATKRSARHRETWTKTETSWVHPSHNKTETCTQTPVSTLVKLRHKPETGSHERQKQLGTKVRRKNAAKGGGWRAHNAMYTIRHNWDSEDASKEQLELYSKEKLGRAFLARLSKRLCCSKLRSISVSWARASVI